MKIDYTPYIDAVLAGASINSQAKLAGLDATALRRLVVKHPDYAAAKAAGLLHAKGLPGAVPVDQSLMDAALADIADGMTAQAAAIKHGMAVATVTKAHHKRNPKVSLNRGGLGTARDAESIVDRARSTVTRCEKALEKAKKDLATLLATK